jgi:NAD(P)-dependent dehydrogenase (short-subunit alcohol dehydrogenase family)
VKAYGTVVVIGGSSGIGLAVARRSLADGATVVIAGRSRERLDAARAELARSGSAADRLSAYPADIGDLAQVTRLFEQVGTLSHLVVTAADLPYGPAVSLPEESILRAVRSKIVGPLFAAQRAAPRITVPGSITLTSGVAASRPAPGGALAATVNGALESLVRALALELAPIRVNAVFPRMGGHPRPGSAGHARCQERPDGRHGRPPARAPPWPPGGHRERRRLPDRR